VRKTLNQICEPAGMPQNDYKQMFAKMSQ